MGAYLLANIKDYVLVKISGETANIVCHVSQKFKKFVTKENGKNTLYLQLTKALY